MNELKPPLDPAVVHPKNSVGMTGAVVSAVGLAGWLVVLGIMLSFPYEEYSGDGQRDLFIGLGNGLLFVVRALVGIVGLSVNTTLCCVGLILSMLGLQQHSQRPAYIGIGLAAGGLLLGFVLTIWRLTTVGLM